MVKASWPELAPVAQSERSLVSLPWPTYRSSGAINLLGAGCHQGNLQSEFVIGSWVWVEKQSGCLSRPAVSLALI